MSWDVDRPSRRVLIRNLPPGASNQSLHDYFCRFGEIVETFVPIDPQTRRPRIFGFVEFRSVAHAQTVRDTVAEIEGTRVSISFVEAKRANEDEPRISQSSAPRGSGTLSAPPPPPAQPAGARLQPPPVAPPPPMNPNTETYRYNTMAGEFVIDASGRLTRRREFAEFADGQLDLNNRSPAGLGGGLLVGAAPVSDAMDFNDPEEEEDTQILFDPLELDQVLKPSEVIDFNDI